MEEIAFAPDGRLTSIRWKVVLPCEFHRKSCTVPSGTYVFVHTDAEGEDTCISTNGSALRFLIRAQTMRCNHLVPKTEHDRIFLTKERDGPMF